ncbi:MAG: hypothetical protein JRE64_14385 [Deltaproteobacteria bacterium]|nr:hypothetical protein [Deltaproteobacteria bacterium]
MSGMSLRDDYPYAQDLKSICKGLSEYIRVLPSNSGEFQLTYFNNLVYDGSRVFERTKPDTFPSCSTFSDYYHFLLHTARALGTNANYPDRKHSIGQLTSISSGYDSIASSVVAMQAGCREAATIKQSTSLWRGSDSGADVAKLLGMGCREVDRTAGYYPHEETIWSVVGRPGVMNWALMDYSEPLCLFFTGCHGDKVWDPKPSEISDPFVIPSVADLGIGEFRLFKGIVHCPVPFWGMRHVRKIKEIGRLNEMKPWTLNTDYDRPIPRKIIEEAGVLRGSFAVWKKNTAHEAVFLWPYSPEISDRFAAFLKMRGLSVPPLWLVKVIRWAAFLDNLFYSNVKSKLGLKKGRRPWDRLAGPSLLFQWANDSLKKNYERGFEAAGAQPDSRQAMNRGGIKPKGCESCEP